MGESPENGAAFQFMKASPSNLEGLGNPSSTPETDGPRVLDKAMLPESNRWLGGWRARREMVILGLRVFPQEAARPCVQPL